MTTRRRLLAGLSAAALIGCTVPTAAAAAAPAAAYTIGSVANLGSPVTDVELSDGLWALDTVAEADGDPYDDTTLSRFEFDYGGTGLRVFQKQPTLRVVNTITGDPAHHQLGLHWRSTQAGAYAEGTADTDTGKITEQPDFSEGCGYLEAFAYDARRGGPMVQFSDCSHGISGPDYFLRTSDGTSAIAAATTTPAVYGLDPTHGRLRVFQHPETSDRPSRYVTVPTGPERSAIALAESRHLVLVATGSRVTALDDRTFRTVRTGTTPGTISDIATDSGAGVLYVTSTAGITVVSLTSGAVLTTIRALGPAGAITVDTGHHVAYIAAGTRVASIIGPATSYG